MAVAKYDKFNKAFSGLISISRQILDKNDPMITEKLNAAIILVKTSVDTPFNIVGPYLAQFSEQISSGDEKFFLNGDFSEHYKDEEADEAEEFITLLRDKWTTLDVKGKEIVFKLVRSMLSTYLEN